MWKSLGSNLNENNAARIAHSQEGLVGVLSSADQDCEIYGRKGHRSLKSPVETVEQIVKDLIQQHVFEISNLWTSNIFNYLFILFLLYIVINSSILSIIIYSAIVNKFWIMYYVGSYCKLLS